MKIKSLFATTLLVAINCAFIYAQSKPSMPVSPEAAALAKMVNYPINLNTGIPSISIPLYQIKSGGLTLPIELLYHSGGFKINERSTSVGLGWSLSSDIQITRSINGLDDFLPTKGYIGNTKMKAHNSSGTTDYPLYTGTPFANRNLYDIAVGEMDGLPDKFSYRLLDKAGSFYFQKNNAGTGYTIVAVPFDNIEIKYNNGQFTITDTDGSVYTFGTQGSTSFATLANDAKELSGGVNSVTGVCVDCVVTTWKCKKVVNSSQTDSLQFTYQRKADISYNTRPESIEYYTNDAPCALDKYYTWGLINQSLDFENLTTQYPFYFLSSPKYIEHFSDRPSLFHLPVANSSGQVQDNTIPFSQTVNNVGRAVAGLAVSKIEFRGGYVDFTGADQLSSIKIMDGSNSEIKTYNFFQSFSTALNTSYAKNANGQSFNGTMYLDSIQAKNGINVYERYSLLYKEKFCFGDHLKGKDAWGYSNDYTAERYSSQSTISVPHQAITQNYYFDNVGCIHFVSATFNIGSQTNTEIPSRDPSQRGILKRIVYPTGGYVDFDFESNKFHTDIINNKQAVRMGGGLRVRSVNYFDGKAVLPVTQKYYRYGELENGIGLAINAPILSLVSGVDYDAYSFSQTTAYLTGPANANFGNDFDPIPTNCINKMCLTLQFKEKKTTYLPASSLDYTYSTGTPIYYTQVTEYNQDMGRSTGKAVYTFYKPNDFGAYYFTSSSKITGSNIDVMHTDGLMGKQKSLKEYKFENGKYSLLHSKDFSYTKYSKPDQVKVV